MGTIVKATQQDTEINVFGAGAMNYSWYLDVTFDFDFAGLREAPDGWSYTITMEHPTKDGVATKTVGHADTMRAIRAIAAGKVGSVSKACQRECRNFVFDRDECDFDADTADQVIQVMVLGAVYFG